MKTLTLLLSLLLAPLSPKVIPEKELAITGSWQIVRAQYGDEPMKEINDTMIIKSFTGTRWSAAFFDPSKKTFEGAGGGTYQLKGNQYTEKLEYYSWDAEAVGKTFVFSMSIENGMLHQRGTIVYKGNKNYVIDEWYKRID